MLPLPVVVIHARRFGASGAVRPVGQNPGAWFDSVSTSCVKSARPYTRASSTDADACRLTPGLTATRLAFLLNDTSFEPVDPIGALALFVHIRARLIALE
jgi:hypothetical protein